MALGETRKQGTFPASGTLQHVRTCFVVLCCTFFELRSTGFEFTALARLMTLDACRDCPFQPGAEEARLISQFQSRALLLLRQGRHRGAKTPLG